MELCLFVNILRRLQISGHRIVAFCLLVSMLFLTSVILSGDSEGHSESLTPSGNVRNLPGMDELSARFDKLLKRSAMRNDSFK